LIQKQVIGTAAVRSMVLRPHWQRVRSLMAQFMDAQIVYHKSVRGDNASRFAANASQQ
jgi:hypothetical protein